MEEEAVKKRRLPAAADEDIRTWERRMEEEKKVERSKSWKEKVRANADGKERWPSGNRKGMGFGLLSAGWPLEKRRRPFWERMAV